MKITQDEFLSKFSDVFLYSYSKGLSDLLNPRVTEIVPRKGQTLKLRNVSQHKHEFDGLVLDYLFFHEHFQAGNFEKATECYVGVARKFTFLFLESDESENSNNWMLPAFKKIISFLRIFACKLDECQKSEKKWKKKIVEIFREIFRSLYRDKLKKFHALSSLCCDMIRLFMKLDQAPLCWGLIKTLSHLGIEDEIETFPKSISCTLYFLWGKLLVFDEKIKEAESKLTWSLNHSNLRNRKNIHEILDYLIPCRMAMGRFPSKQLLDRTGFSHYIGLCSSISSGNLNKFRDEIKRNWEIFVRSGTLLVVEKLVFLVYRTLFRKIFNLLIDKQEYKISLNVFEKPFGFSTRDEFLLVLATLISLGGIRGYLSKEHFKVVLSKETMFLPIQNWTW